MKKKFLNPERIKYFNCLNTIVIFSLFIPGYLFAQQEPSKSIGIDKISLSIGGIYRTSILDNNVNTFTLQFSRYFDNTKGVGANIGTKILLKNSTFINLNTNIRYDYTHTRRDPLTNKAIEDIKELLFDPSIGIGRNFRTNSDDIVYLSADLTAINFLKKFNYLNEYVQDEQFSLSYLAVGLSAGYVKNNIFIEPKIQFIPKGQYPFGTLTSHTMLSLKVGYMIDVLRTKRL